MKRTGVAILPLHGGRVPPWLISRMKKLSKGIAMAIIDENGPNELLNRIANPIWFQALGCVIGHDWHSSGVTTVITGILREVLDPKETGIAVAGGKGKKSTKAPSDLEQIGGIYNLSEQQIDSLKYSSRMAAKVDNALVQDGYQLYHHTFFVTENGKWAVVQQGMCPDDRSARRYHWLSDKVKSFVEEPHEGIVCDLVKNDVLNMTSKEAAGCQKVSIDVTREGVRRVKLDFLSLRPIFQKTLDGWVKSNVTRESHAIHVLKMPRYIDWNALRTAYETQPRNYEELVAIRGIGPATVRALALISEMIYGTPANWIDPVKYSFAVGGKDGVPFPVNRRVYDESIEFLEHAIDEAKLGGDEKAKALRGLMRFAPKEPSASKTI